MTETLQQIWQRLANEGYKTDKGSIHSYIEVYEEILAPYRETAKNVLEIGVFKGDSLRMWEAYFTQARVYGIDCSDQPIDGMADLRPMIAEGTHNIFIGDATSEEYIDNTFRDTKFDIVWDDGSHQLSHQIQTVNIFKNRLAYNGCIIIEDIENIDRDRWIFDAMSFELSVEIMDLRHIKGRFDDAIVIIKNK